MIGDLRRIGLSGRLSIVEKIDDGVNGRIGCLDSLLVWR